MQNQSFLGKVEQSESSKFDFCEYFGVAETGLVIFFLPFYLLSKFLSFTFMSFLCSVF